MPCLSQSYLHSLAGWLRRALEGELTEPAAASCSSILQQHPVTTVAQVLMHKALKSVQLFGGTKALSCFLGNLVSYSGMPCAKTQPQAMLSQGQDVFCLCLIE